MKYLRTFLHKIFRQKVKDTTKEDNSNEYIKIIKMAKIDNLILKYRVAKRSADGLNRIDPTSNGKYLDWLFKMKFVKRKDANGNEKYYVSGSFPANLHADVNKILAWMEKNGNNPTFKTEYKDINFFKSVDSLIKTMGPLCVPSKKEIKDQVIKVMEDERWLIVVPKTFDASKMYGMNTKWCTTQKTYFDQYNRTGFLFYIIDKTHNVKFGVPVNTSGNGTTLNVNGLELYNNVDKGLRWSAVMDIYGSETMSKLSTAMSSYFRELKLESVRKRTLESAIANLKSVKATFARDRVYENDEANKMLEELMNTLAGDLK